MAASCLAESEVFNGQDEIITPVVTSAPITEPCLGSCAGSDLDSGETGDKHYHELEPPTKPLPKEPSGCGQTLPKTMFASESILSASCKPRMTRRSRRLVKDENVPLKKRKRIIVPHLEEEEYILPAHVQLQAEKETVVGRRLRSKRSVVPVGDLGSEPASDSDTPLVSLAKQEPKSEPTSEGEEPSEPRPLVIVPTPPKRKRGRPRKNEMPQRLLLAPGRPPVRVQPSSPPVPVRPGPGRPRKGRKSTAPARRRPAPTPSPSLSPPAPLLEELEKKEVEMADPVPVSPLLQPARPTSPPTELLTLSCPGLPAAAPATLSDGQFTIDVPTRRLFPCPHCASLTSRPSAGTRDNHVHSSTREVQPRCRLLVELKSAPRPASEPGRPAGLRPCRLSDHSAPEPEEYASEKGWPRRGRRRAGMGRGGAHLTGGRELECATCGKLMLSISRLKKHQLVHTEERPFHCDKCPKSFKSVHVLNAHQLTHINYRPFRCDICHQTFAKKWTLRGHMATHERHEDSNDLVCRECGCAFQDRSTYESHVKIHTGERKWECKVCHRGFAKKLKLRKHMVVHSQAMLHKCHLCDREFRWKEKLVKHVMLHTGERPFKCTEPRCVKSFRAHSDLNVHIRNVHKKQPKKLDYPIVKSEPKPNHCELLLMRVNEMEGIPPCDLCTEHFSSKDEYLNHIIPAHRDQEAYVCHPCKRVFDNKRIYDDHIEERHRRGEIMWRCQLCPKIFNKRSLFEGHKTLHATKFQCKICFRFASDEKRLQVHIMNHRYTDIDNSSHACTICSRQFKLRFSLKNHMFKMHSIDLPSLRKPPMRKFECSICHARFVRPTPAYNHMVRVHNIRPEPEVQDMFDLTTLSVEHPEALSYPDMDPEDPSVVAALQNNIRIKVEAMAAQGMWDASEADGSTYLGGSAARRRSQPTARESRMPAGGDTPPPAPPPPQKQQTHPPPPPRDVFPADPGQGAFGPAAARAVPAPLPPSASDQNDSSVKTLLHLSPGKRSELVRVSQSSPSLPPPPQSVTTTPPTLLGVPTAAPPGADSVSAAAAGGQQQQQIIVIQQDGEDDIDLSRVLGASQQPADAQTLTMNADGVLVDDQGRPVSLLVEGGGGGATHLLDYLRGPEPDAGGPS